MKPSKYCNQCGEEFLKRATLSSNDWEQTRYCSQSCAAKARAAVHLIKHQFAIGNMSGTRFTSETTSGELNSKWKGGEAGYAAIHIWVGNNFGRAKECEHCGTTEDRRYHWANISGKYTRERSDWLRLCVPCHKKYDITRLDGKIKPRVLKSQPTKTCPQCQIVFSKKPKFTQTQWLNQAYCGRACSAAAQAGTRRTTDNPEKQCIACGKTFYKQRYNSQKNWAIRQYCDRKCGSEATAKARTGVKESEAVRKIRSAGQIKRHAKRRAIETT